MKINVTQYSSFLNRVAEDLDIPPSKYEDAVDPLPNCRKMAGRRKRIPKIF